MKNKKEADSTKKGGKKEQEKVDNGSMPLTGHLREMRNRVAVCLAVFAAAFLICLNFAARLITLMTDMGASYQYSFVYLAPQELLMS
jgi:sec-independent protein translocase protein TatC